MKSLFFNRTGTLEDVIEWGNVADPVLSQGQVLVKVSAVLDCVGGTQGQRALESLSEGGTFVAYGDCPASS